MKAGRGQKMIQRYDIEIHRLRLNQDLLTVDELGRIVGVHPQILRKYFIYGLIDPKVEKPEPLFEETIVARVRKIERLKADLGLNMAGCGLVLDLLERITELEVQLQQLRCRR